MQKTARRASVRAASARMRWSLGVRPDVGRFAVVEELDVDDVRVAAHGTIFDVLLLAAAGRVERDHDLLAAGGADV